MFHSFKGIVLQVKTLTLTENMTGFFFFFFSKIETKDFISVIHRPLKSLVSISPGDTNLLTSVPSYTDVEV